AIESGVLEPGARLPSWQDLATQLGVARASSSRRANVEFVELLYLGHSYVQQAIELGPNPIFLGAGDMAKGAFVLRFQFAGWRLWRTMIKIVVSPAAGIGIALGILNSYVGAIERPGEITSSRRLGSRTVGVLSR